MTRNIVAEHKCYDIARDRWTSDMSPNRTSLSVSAAGNLCWLSECRASLWPKILDLWNRHALDVNTHRSPFTTEICRIKLILISPVSVVVVITKSHIACVLVIIGPTDRPIQSEFRRALVIILHSVGVWCIVTSMYVCLSVCPLTCLKTHVQISSNFLYMLPVVVARSSWLHCNKLRTSGFVDDVMFSHNRAKGQNQRRRACFVLFAR